MIEFGNEKHGLEIARAAGFLFNAKHDVVITRSEEERLYGGVVLYDYTGRSVSMHVAGFVPHWINRDILWVTFNYPFKQLGCSSIFCQVRSNASHTRRFVEKIGFHIEVVISDVFPDADLVVYRMYDKDCPWMNIRPRGIVSGVTMNSNIGG
jgi:hypothetical protein